MNHLVQPHPLLFDAAAPASLRCGRREGDATSSDESDWALLTWTFAGLWEIEPAALQA